MDRRLFLHLQGGRKVSGVLRGFDMFLNLVVDNAFEELGAGERKPCGMIVSLRIHPVLRCAVVRCEAGVSGRGGLGIMGRTVCRTRRTTVKTGDVPGRRTWACYGD